MVDMQRKAKVGLTVLGLIGVIYAGIGGLFLVMGIVFTVTLPRDVIMLGLIFAGVGLIFFVLGLVFLGYQIKKKRLADEMLSSGRYIWGEVTDCVENRMVKINHRHPCYLQLRYTDMMGQPHYFRSRDLRIAPDDRLIGRQVRVYYRDNSFREYYVDAEELVKNYII